MPRLGSAAPQPPLFHTEPLELTRPGKLRFVKLLKEGKCQFDDFLAQLEWEGGYTKEVDALINLMDQRGRLKHLPGTKHHDLGFYIHTASGRPYQVRLYEFKTANLRVYYFHHPPDNEVIVLMGKKNTQDQDLNSFESLVGQYLQFLL